MIPGWVETAKQFLNSRRDIAAVAGRLRERHPDASVFNRLADAEWAVPAGEARSCGGIAMMRLDAFASVGLFDPSLIAGEEPELCIRLRQAGWRIWRLNDEMALHDIAMTRISQWWRRSRRAGYAFAEGAVLHGTGPERHYVAETRRAIVWGAAIPLLTLTASLISPWYLLLFAAYPVQIARMVLRGEDGVRAAFLLFGKFPEAQGVIGYALDRFRSRRAAPIEYK